MIKRHCESLSAAISSLRRLSESIRELR